MAHGRTSVVGDYLPLHITSLATSATAVGASVNTTSATTIVAGLNTVTPASMANLVEGQWLNFANGTGAAENVQIFNINTVAGTFQANFANGHSGAYTIISLRGTYLGKLVINQAGTGVTITLYNGHPSTSPAGTPIAVLTGFSIGQSYDFNCSLQRGLFYTVAGTTPGDYTITYLDMPV